MTSSSSAAALPVSPPPCSSAVPAARSPFSIPACRATASPAIRMVCSATITSHRWTSWPRRGSSWRAIPRSGWSMPGRTASPAPSTISPSSLAMAKALARRLILSYGVADQMPDVPGFAEGWGASIVPCPYCDGFEVAGQHWGLVWSGRQSHNYVRLYHDWTDTLTLFADGHDIPPDIRADLAHRNIPVVDGRITGIAHHGGHNATVKLDTGPNVAVDILFAHPRNKPSASLHESLGLATVDTPGGIALKVDERRETSMPGIYAAGDLANPLMPSVTLASSHGATAGISAQQSMLV